MSFGVCEKCKRDTMLCANDRDDKHYCIVCDRELEREKQEGENE